MQNNFDCNFRKENATKMELLDYIKLLENKLIAVEQRSRLTEKQYKTILDNVKQVIFQTDANGVWTFLNQIWTEFTGFSVDESIGNSFLDYVHLDDRQRNSELFAPLIGRKKDYCRHEIRYLTKGGGFLWVEVYARLALDEEGNTIGTSGTLTDITDRMRTQQALRESEERYRQLFMRSPAAKLLIDPVTGSIIDANRAAVIFYGYTLDELQAMTIFQISTAAHEEIEECMAKASKDYCKAIPFQHRVKDGGLREVEVYSGAVEINGNVLLHSIVVDVTARKKAEQDLRESRERLALVIQGAKAGVWDWNMQSNQVYYDRQWQAILGYEENEINDDINMWISRWHPDDVAYIKSATEEYFQGKTEKYEVKYRLQHRDGTYRWILTNGQVIYDKDGQPVRWTGFNIDITDQKRIEELYLESEKRLREFAEAVPDVSFIIDEDGRYIEAFGNKELLPIPKEQFGGLSVYQVLQADDADYVLSEVRQVIASNQKRWGIREFKIGQSKRCILGRMVPLSYMVGGKRTVAVIATDITDQRKTERILQVTYELRRRSDLINDILNGREGNDENLAYLSGKLGLDLSKPAFICKFAFNNKSPQKTNCIQKCKDEIIDALSDIPDSVVWDCREGIGVLCQAALKNGDWKRSKDIAAFIRDKLLAYDPGLMVSVGVSDVDTGIQGLKKSYRQAQSAAIAARCLTHEGIDIVHYREAGIFQFIPDLFGRDAIKGYIESNIGKLIAYDREKKTNYLATLAEILRGSSVRQAADKLFLHPKTIVFRQKRIEKILNVDLSVYQTRLALAIALQLLQMDNT